MPSPRRRLAMVALVAAVAGCATKEQPTVARAAGTGSPKPKVWKGQWRTPTMHVDGEVTVTVMEYPGAAYVTYQVAGDPLGCGGPLEGGMYLQQGVDYSRTGFMLNSFQLGLLDLSGRHRRLRGAGGSGCGDLHDDYTARTRVGRVAVSGKLLLNPQAGGTERTTFRVKLCKTCTG